MLAQLGTMSTISLINQTHHKAPNAQLSGEIKADVDEKYTHHMSKVEEVQQKEKRDKRKMFNTKKKKQRPELKKEPSYLRSRTETPSKTQHDDDPGIHEYELSYK